MSDMNLTQEQLEALPKEVREQIKAFADRKMRQYGAATEQFGDHIYSALVGESKRVISVTRRPANGSKIKKGTYLVTNFRPSQIFELEPHGGSFIGWLALYAREQMEEGLLEDV